MAPANKMPPAVPTAIPTISPCDSWPWDGDGGGVSVLLMGLGSTADSSVTKGMLGTQRKSYLGLAHGCNHTLASTSCRRRHRAPSQTPASR